MTEEIKNTEVIEDTTRDGLEKTDKVYSEMELQKIIKERIAREKSASRQALDDATNAKTSLEETLSKYEALLTKQVEAKAGDIPEKYKKLFDKLTLAEKLDFLADMPEDEPETKTQFPKTPQSNGGDITPKVKTQKFRI